MSLSHILQTQPNSARAVDRSVLKNLTDFAEKVKNPPPKDWSEFNRKQIEKAKALVTSVFKSVYDLEIIIMYVVYPCF